MQKDDVKIILHEAGNKTHKTKGNASYIYQTPNYLKSSISNNYIGKNKSFIKSGESYFPDSVPIYLPCKYRKLNCSYTVNTDNSIVF